MVVLKILGSVLVAAALVTVSLSTDTCPIAEVGMSYDILCKGTTPTSGRFVMWDEFNKTGPIAEISRCYFNDSCIPKDARYKTTNRPNLMDFESTLTITNVSADDADRIIKCRALDTTDKAINIFRSCQLSVFSLERKPSCHATKVFPNDVMVTCDFQRVHPKVTCLLGYQGDAFVKDVTVDYDEKPLSSAPPIYYNVTCEGLLKMKDATQRRYFMKVSPNFERDIAVEELEKHSFVLEINLTASAREVVINRPRDVYLCPPNYDVLVTVNCTALIEVQNPTFHFFVNDVEISMSSTSLYIEEKMYGVVQVYNFNVTRASKDVRLKCQVADIKKSANINVVIPPSSPPTFQNQSLPLSPSISLGRNQTLSAECSAVGGRPPVSDITVTCLSANGTKTLQVRNSSNIVYFMIHEKDHPAASYCECRASHASGCYDGAAKLMIVDGNVPRGSGDHFNAYTVLYFIAAAVAALIFIPIVVATCIFVFRHWDQLYSKYYGVPPRKRDSQYEYIDHVADPRVTTSRHSRKISAQSESSISNTSDYVARYRDHIELHHLPDTIVDEEAHLSSQNSYTSHPPMQLPPPCGRSGAAKVGSRGDSNSEYEKSIPPSSTRHPSSTSDDSMPPPPPPPPLPAKPQLKYDGSSIINNNYCPSDDDDESVYITPRTPPSSSMEKLPLRGREKRLEEEAEEEERKKEEEYLLKRLAQDEFSSDEDLP